MSDRTKGLRDQSRPQSRTSIGDGPDVLPNDAFEWENPESDTTPLLTLKSPWHMKIEDGFEVDSTVTFDSDVNISGDADISGDLTVSGTISGDYGMDWTIVTVDTSVTLIDGDTNLVLRCRPGQASDTNVTVTLPTLANNLGRHLRVEHSDADSGVVYIEGEGSDTLGPSDTTIGLWYQGDNKTYCGHTDYWSDVKGPQWHLVSDPGTGWFDTKTSWTGSNNFSSHGWTVDFSSVVPKGTKAIKCVVAIGGTVTAWYWRKYNDTNISNTPDTDNEYSHRVRINTAREIQFEFWLDNNGKIEITGSGTSGDLYISYPFAYLL